ncbi:hypothetical protein [Aeromicrobium sp. CTD01-1L150]|uniref:hypothetical protein n=1 Tax=Aeromicrobium sp. CTD01-1L150 TaxID=3341830 RepID=UPI0035C22CAD
MRSAIVAGAGPHGPACAVTLARAKDAVTVTERGDRQPIYAYAHVPRSHAGDATKLIIKQIECFAPGIRDRISATAVRTTAERRPGAIPTNIGGDIVTGATMGRQLVFRPHATLWPYDTAVPGVHLCSAATPTGIGPQGACGHHTATRALACL